MIGAYNEPASFGVASSPGLIFAKRKKTPFRGPMLNMNVGGGGGGSPSPARRDSGNGSRSTSVTRRRSGELIAPIGEEDEDEVEEVEGFSPVPDEEEETVLEGREDGMAGWVDYAGGQ
jgi:hypothetical protein